MKATMRRSSLTKTWAYPDREGHVEVLRRPVRRVLDGSAMGNPSSTKLAPHGGPRVHRWLLLAFASQALKELRRW